MQQKNWGSVLVLFVFFVGTFLFFARLPYKQKLVNFKKNQSNLADLIASSETKAKRPHSSTSASLGRLPASEKEYFLTHPRLGTLTRTGLVALPPRTVQELRLKSLGSYRGWELVEASSLPPNFSNNLPIGIVAKTQVNSEPRAFESMIRIKITHQRYLSDLQAMLQNISLNDLDKHLNIYFIKLPLDPSSPYTVDELLQKLSELSYIKSTDIPELLPRVESI